MKIIALFSFITFFTLSDNLVNANTKIRPEKETVTEEMYMFPGWNRKQVITIQSSQVAGASNHTDFPVLVTLDHLNSEIVDGGVNSALNGGGDIRFSSDAVGNSQLAIEVVEFVTSSTPANRKCQIWVKVPSLSATSNTTIYIWYNKSGETQPSASSTYGSQSVWSNYHFVSHDGLYDSATNQNLTVNGSPTVGTTPYGGKSWKGNGTSDYTYLADGGIDLSGSFSVSIWKKNDSPRSTFGTSIGVRNNNGWLRIATHAPSDSKAAQTFYASEPPTEASGEGARILPTGDQFGWHFFFVGQTTAVGETELMKGDGVATTMSPTGSYAWSRPVDQNFITIGNKSPNDNSILYGELAEVRLSQSIISSEFSDTDYNNMINPAGFAIAGTPESVSGGGSGDTQPPTAPTLSSNGQTDNTADLSWSGATDNIGVTGYNVYLDGAIAASNVNTTSNQVTGLTASTTYSFTVTALDAAGNESPASTAVSITTDSSSGGGGGSGSSVWSESNSVASYNGDIAVGTTIVPTGYKMAIDGKLITEEVKVQLSGNWPDYVFKEGYDLLTLEEIQKHIQEKGHLPNIPSAKEVKANGIELGEMNRLLLEKIEELTLHVIQLKKEIETLQKIQNQ